MQQTAIQKALSPNYDPTAIKVQFCVLHYTAVDIKTCLQYFANSQKKVSAHFVIGQQGAVFECVPAIPKAFRAWHAGVSEWQDSAGANWHDLNSHAIGIELENWNGNFFDYPPIQIDSLIRVMRLLQSYHPALCKAENILGHQDIAGFRGKIDPGLRFPWEQFFYALFKKKTYKQQTKQHAICQQVVQNFSTQIDFTQKNSAYWAQKNLQLEQLFQKAIQKKGAQQSNQ